MSSDVSKLAAQLDEIEEMNKVYLLLGSNIGDSKKHLTTSKNIISKRIGTIIRSSAIYSTAAWGKKDQPDFLNQIIILNIIIIHSIN